MEQGHWVPDVVVITVYVCMINRVFNFFYFLFFTGSLAEAQYLGSSFCLTIK
jgi:hypothetical protein